MIRNDREFEVTLERIARFQRQLSHLRNAEGNVANYRASASGYLAELDRMQREVGEYLALHPSEFTGSEA